MRNSNITEISIFLNSGNNEHFLSIHLKANTQKHEQSFPMKEISLDELVKLHSQKATGIVYRRNGHLFYGEVPKLIKFGKFSFDLSKVSYESSCTVAYMEQIQIFRREYADIRVFFNNSEDSIPCLATTTMFSIKEFIHIIREGKDNPNRPRKEIIYERLLKHWKEVNEYPMCEVSEEELMQHRLSKIPGVVYKRGDHLFYTRVPNTINLNTDFERSAGRHACGEHCSMVCQGCPRTSDFTVNSQRRYGKAFPKAIQDSWRIEKYPFVLEGIESFNMGSTSEACLVFKCENYKTRSKMNTYGIRPSKDAKLSLAHLYWDDFNGDYNEMRLRIKKHTG